MRSKAIIVLIAVAGFLAGPCPMSAHHGIAHYDMNKTVVLTGTMTAFNWGNPHCLVHMDVTGEGGRVQHWTLEMSSISAMSRRGWTKDTLKLGDMVIAETHPARSGIPLGISANPDFNLKFVVNGKNVPPR